MADDSAGQVDQGKAQRLHAPHVGPSTSHFITAFRLWARIMSHAALAPNSPLGIRPVHNRLLALAAASAPPPDHLIARQRAVGDDAEQLEAGGELLGGKRQLRGIVQCRSGSRIARKR